MLRHVVMMQLSPSITKDQLQAIVDSLRALPDVVPEIQSYSVGLDMELVDGNFDLVVVGDFEDVDAFRGYSANADHQLVIAEKIAPFVLGRSAVQYTMS